MRIELSTDLVLIIVVMQLTTEILTGRQVGMQVSGPTAEIEKSTTTFLIHSTGILGMGKVTID